MSIHRLFQCGLKSPKYSNHRQKAIPYIAVFQSLRSLRTATPSGPTPPGTAAYFNPRSPCGPQLPSVPSSFLRGEFQSLRSLRTATPSRLAEARAAAGISILAVLADRDRTPSRRCHYTSPISILAVLADREPGRFLPGGPCAPISILAVLADRDLVFGSRSYSYSVFQSSRSLRTATGLRSHWSAGIGISILAVLADRDLTIPGEQLREAAISILAVLADRDPEGCR